LLGLDLSGLRLSNARPVSAGPRRADL